MQTKNFNWYPTDPYGQTWRFVYYIDIEDRTNYDKIELAEVSKCDNFWTWKFLQNSLFRSVLSGFSRNRDEAMHMVSSMIQ